jgi:hypothetical protein
MEKKWSFVVVEVAYNQGINFSASCQILFRNSATSVFRTVGHVGSVLL